MEIVLKRLDEILKKIKIQKQTIRRLEAENRHLRDENDHLKSDVEKLRRQIKQIREKEAWGIFAGEWAGQHASKEKALQQINRTLKLIDKIMAGLKNHEG